MTAQSVALAIAAGVAGAGFAAVVARRALATRRPQDIAWTIGLVLYSLAAFVEATAEAGGWSVFTYRVFFATAGATAGALGAGTIYLAAPRRAGHVFAGVMAALFVTAAFGQLSVVLAADTPVTVDGETRALADWGGAAGGKPVPFPHPARVAFLVMNVVGGLALIAGAVASWWQHRRIGVLLIGLGALLPFTAGSLSTAGLADARLIAQFAGVLVMFTGYLVAARPSSSAQRKRAHAAR